MDYIGNPLAEDHRWIILIVYTMSGRTCSALGWNSEGRSFDLHWFQQVL